MEKESGFIKTIVVLIILALLAFFGYFVYKNVLTNKDNLSSQGVRGIINKAAEDTQSSLEDAKNKAIEDAKSSAADTLKDKIDETLKQ